MGRAHWLRGAQSESITELRRSIELSPNFALGHYTLGFVECQSGDPKAAIEAVSYSRQLSPFDPLQFGMLGSRALSHIRLGQLEEATEWAIRATQRPNAHAHIVAIGAISLALVDRREEAMKLVARIRERLPAYNIEDFLRSFRFKPDMEKMFRQGVRPIGFDA
jgi:tetratricopeptide (TPR) repeat protein